MKRAMKLNIKIALLVIVVVFISILIIISFAVPWMTSNIESKEAINIMNVAKMAANSEEVVYALKEKDVNGKIENYIKDQINCLEQVEYIIVADNSGIRYSHPNHKSIGYKFAGGDEKRVVENGESYISEATGTLGRSLRAFVPIYDIENDNQIGFVCVGTLIQSVDKAKNEAIVYILLIALGGLMSGTVGAFLLARSIKNTLMGLEPDEITKLYNEKIGMLEAIHEGLVAVDQKECITLINDSALNILHFENKINKEDIIGQKVEDVIPNTRLSTILETGKAEYEEEQRTNNTIIMTNRVPIISRGKIVGAIASFRDKTYVTKMAEELTGAKKIAWSLRAQNHEFMNKLHTISGLIQLEEYDKCLQFISDIAKVRVNISNILTENIKDASVSALLLSKYNKAEEIRVNFTIDKDSRLTELPEYMTSDEIISIIGNLIENSLDIVKNDGSGSVYIKIIQDEKYLNIEVKNNGDEIPIKDRERIYEQGFSTKEGQRGHGMYIVKKIIDEFYGTINFYIDEGVIWKITIPMQRGVNSDSSNDN
ncbi:MULTISPECIES: sensor histidine kinase [Clostridium]|uniref:sensor histidine kinase n=1 Tax=Clostridium TaxID=1485 RepID=UPI00257F5987|nr:MULTISPECIES: sensor histidine kinase [Clostridium]MBS4842659.1 sensor histidine kinase [Clostridium sp.]MDU1403975.1 sensor histidine kinase [Clostridium sp.]MDU1605362.1 sensor histidine kinase [Clostridium sp.]MDU2896953.1 sensor histidine kinase [Clostridium sp.]MDU3009127.1 sensor histidine kinase [Clostridium sp.]